MLKSDEGNAVVVLDTVNYQQKMTKPLKDKAFKELKKDPKAKLERASLSL